MPEGGTPTRTSHSFQLPNIEFNTQSSSIENHVMSDYKNLKSDNESKFHLPNWTVDDVIAWARTAECLSSDVINCLKNEKIDGICLLALCEDDIRDMRYRLNYQLPFGDLKKLWLLISNLQEHYKRNTAAKKDALLMGSIQWPNGMTTTTPIHQRRSQQTIEATYEAQATGYYTNESIAANAPNNNSDMAELWVPADCCTANIPPEFFKTFISLGYSFLVTWITSFVMVIVHERVPDMKRYPPLPDIFLDNVPHIPWAFHMCEITGTLLFAIWSCVCIFHKYRMVLLRRFFALAGTVFLLRCVTMLITSLSVPGTHLQCDQSDYAVDDADLTLKEALELRILRAYTIWSGLGMSIQGVCTCGDYMFSGHTVALTLLNFFITEYTPRNLYFLHTLTWLLNMFGIFFILAAHEHYSIDVFVAFYITSRLFLYYHTLANNQALMSRDSTRTRIWFPMFSYFESSVIGIIPNEFDTVSTLLEGLLRLLMECKDTCMMTAQRLSVDRPQLALARKFLQMSKQQPNAATSTQTAVNAASGFRTPASTSATDLHAENNGNSSANVVPTKTTNNNNTKTTTTPPAGATANKQSFFSTPAATSDDTDLYNEAEQIEQVNGNASVNVTPSKAAKNNNNSRVTKTTSPATTTAAALGNKQKTDDRDFTYKVKIQQKKQL